MQKYTAKDPKVAILIQQLHANYGEIDNIRLVGNGEGGGWDVPSSHPRNRPTVTFDPDEDKSLITGIKEFFSRDKSESMAGRGGGDRKSKLTASQWDTIRYKLDNIDMLLKKECLFCGIILIDMIDNDIEESNAKLYEFSPVMNQASGNSNSELG